MQHHHGPPDEMTPEEAESYLNQFSSWRFAAQGFPPGLGRSRCCARVHPACLRANGERAGNTRAAIFRMGVRDGWKLCNYCYPGFDKARRQARQALNLHPNLAFQFAALVPHVAPLVPVVAPATP
jgi:hypothetical protein